MSDPVELYAKLTAAFDRRDWQRAAQLAAMLRALVPRHPGVSYIGGIAHLELQQLPPALTYLRMAAALEPARADFAIHHAKALALSQRTREARAEADRALALGPTDPMTFDTLGVVYTQVGAYALAAQAFREAVSRAPGHAAFRYNLATSLVAAGDIDAAEAELEACLARDPAHWLAHLTLAHLRKQTPRRNHLPRLQSLLERVAGQPAETEALMCLHMALAKEHEDLGQYPAAFGHLLRGKAAGGIGEAYCAEQDEALFAAITASFPPMSPADQGCATDEPIFIIGMPRSGTTLVERIISSHPQVLSAGELLNFPVALKRASGSQTRALVDVDTITRARQVDRRQLGASYLASTRPVTGTRARFIDKLPHNFLYAGFIAQALPNARIVCLRRDPMDTCLSNFRQLFAPRSPFFGYSFGLLDTGRYYLLFDRLMAHWQRMFPGRILEVAYEDLVYAQEVTSRQLLAFCGLPWDDACLHFEHNAAPVATASAVQVRAPMHQGALGRWRNYEQQLRGLQDLLRAGGVLPAA